MTRRRLLQQLFILNKHKQHCRLHKRLAFMMIQRLFTSRIPLPLGPKTREKRSCVWHSEDIVFSQAQAVVSLMGSLAEHWAVCIAGMERDAELHGVIITIFGALAAICDAVLRSPVRDLEDNCSGIKAALDQGFGVSSAIFVKQAEIFPVFAPKLLNVRAEVLDYFSEQGQPRHAIFSWELQSYKFPTQDRDNVEFAKALCKSLDLESLADIRFVYANLPVQTQLFPEFGGYRDVTLWWKWAMCPDAEAYFILQQGRIDITSAAVKYQVRQSKVYVNVFEVDNIFECVDCDNIAPDGVLFPSHTRASQYTAPNEVHTENDVLHLTTLPDFDGALSQRDAELFLSYLTVPYLRIPLLLDFFSKDYRMYALRSCKLRRCLECALSECARFLPCVIWSDPSKVLPTEVPAESQELLATSHGLLVNELVHSPHSILQPLHRLVDWAKSTAKSSVKDDSFAIVLYICRVASRVCSFCNYVVGIQLGLVPGFEVWQTALQVSQGNLQTLQDQAKALEASLFGDGTDTSPSMVSQLQERLREIEVKSTLFCASTVQGGEGCRNGTRDASGPAPIDDEEMLEYVRLSTDIHAHLILLYQGTSAFNVRTCRDALVSVMYLTVRHTWDQNARDQDASDDEDGGQRALSFSEAEATTALDVVRGRAFFFMEGLAEQEDGRDGFVSICQGVYEAVMARANPNPSWCKVQNKRGIYVVCAGPLPTSTSRVPVVADSGQYGTELDLQLLELRVDGAILRGLDGDIVRDIDVQSVLGKTVTTVQCVELRNTESCRERKIVGTRTQVHVTAWSQHKTSKASEMDREYIPLELFESELWIAELFEPIRSKFFVPPTCKAEVQFFFLEDKELPKEATCAQLTAIHPSNQGAWFHVVLLKEMRSAEVYVVDSHGGQYLLRPFYVSNLMYSHVSELRDVDPRGGVRVNSQDREEPWERWGRHEAKSRSFGDFLKHLMPPDFNQSCTLTRFISVPGSDVERTETFIPHRFLNGLIPMALANAHVFWQDDQSPTIIRGYLKAKDGQVVDMTEEKLTLDLACLSQDHSAALRATGMAGVGARISRCDSSSSTPEILLNALHAPATSPLVSVVRTLSRVEKATNLLVWGVADTEGRHRITRVEMQTLQIGFTAVQHKGVDEESRTLLVSDELPGFYVADQDLPAAAKQLLEGVPQVLILSSLQQEWCALVPNTMVTRPNVKPRPFSTELVFDADHQQWKKNAQVPYFTYRLHQSGLSLVPEGLSSALYLLVLKLLHRDYARACSMVAGISTDAALSKQENQIIQLLKQTTRDNHPDAVACRVKVELALADCPVHLPWDIRVEAGRYFEMLRHVSATCRLSQREEEMLIRLCKETAVLYKLVSDAAKRYHKDSRRMWLRILLDPEFRMYYADPRSIQDAESFVSALLEMIHAKRGQHLDRERLMFFLERLRDQNDPVWTSVLNREKYLLAKSKKEYSTRVLYPARKRAVGFQHHFNGRIRDAKDKDFNGIRAYYSRPSKVIRGRAAVELALNLWRGQSPIDRIFLLVYELLSQNLRVHLLDSPYHTFGSLLFYMSDDCRGGSLLASVCSILYHNPGLCALANMPKLKDNRSNSYYPYFFTDPFSHEPLTPLRTLLEDFVEYIKPQAIKSPPDYKTPAFANRSAGTVCIDTKVAMLDETPACEVTDFQRPDLQLQGRKAWASIMSQSDEAQRLLYGFDENVLKERPLFGFVESFLVAKKGTAPPDDFPFVVEKHLEGCTKECKAKRAGDEQSEWKGCSVECEMIQRLKKDYSNLREISRRPTSVAYVLKALHDKEERLARGNIEVLNAACDDVSTLMRSLKALRESDMAFFSNAQSLVVDIANGNPWKNASNEQAPAIPPASVVVTGRNFEHLVRNAGHWVVLKVFMPNCPFCSKLLPLWEDLVQAFDGTSDVGTVADFGASQVSFATINGPSELPKEFGIEEFPALLLFKGDGSVPRKYAGALDFSSLAAFVSKETCATVKMGFKPGMGGTQETTNSIKMLQLRLMRISEHRPFMPLSFLVRTMLSSQMDNPADNEWKRVNPFIDHPTVVAASDILCVALLHAIRAGTINLALGQLHLLLTELEQLRSKPANPGTADKEDENAKNVKIVLQQMSASLGEIFAGRRTYVRETGFKPHFLVFEFLSSMMLRVRQVEIVTEIVQAIHQAPACSDEGKNHGAVVKQMIMGSGKTTVVSPLLVMMLADSKSLVLQVMPAALLDFSRGVMRSALSAVDKRVCTLNFERSDSIDSRLFFKLKNAAQSGSVVVATPSGIKSMMLKTVENMLGIRDQGNLHRRQLTRQVKEASRLFSLLSDAVIIMDEVDMILHPLKSELNFPIGQKDPLPNSPMRWKFPIYLLSFFILAGADQYDPVKNPGADQYDPVRIKKMFSNRHFDVIERMRKALHSGAEKGSMQRRPHWVLVNSDFYSKELLELFVKLSLLYCDASGIDTATHLWVVEYLKSPKVDPEKMKAQVEGFYRCSEQDRVRLNMIRVWLHLVLAHILQKVDRVSFGLMNEQDCKRALEADPRMPRSRINLAIPFVGKDAPSSASEFAHPDVTIGLSILAYRYEGLRLEHLKDILRALKANLAREIGEPADRPSALLFKKWVEAAGGTIQSEEKMSFDGEHALFSLDRLKLSNEEHVAKAFALLRKHSAVIEYWLLHIFGVYMRHQHLKISASAQELGSDMLFKRRIGFSGTPSSLIPRDLGDCQFEPGSEASILETLSSPIICGVIRHEDTDWRAESILDVVANGKYHALIDTGALVTGMSNLQVAKYLLDNGLKKRGIQGVVYLDEADRKMVLIAESGSSVKLEECGLQLSHRFAFYDQIHTTGMDIKHTPNARALITLGKDMVLRDLAQGAYRMRGIGKGQTVDFFLIPEVLRLVDDCKTETEQASGNGEQVSAQLKSVLMWLLDNSLRTERTQFSQLQMQNCANVFRKVAFAELLKGAVSPSSAMLDDVFCASLEAFREKVSFSIESEIPKEVTVLQRIDDMQTSHPKLISPDGEETIADIKASLSSNDNAVTMLEQEQQQEQEQEQENEKEQEIEIEKVADLAYSTEHEEIKAWKFRDILELSPERGLDGRLSFSKPFFPLLSFKLWGRDPLHFPGFLGASSNFYNLEWSGERRIKNVCMLLDVMPNATHFKDPGGIDLACNDPQCTRCKTAEPPEAHVQSSLQGLAHLVRNTHVQGKELEELVKAILGYFETDSEDSSNLWKLHDSRITEIVKSAVENGASIPECLKQVLENAELNHVHQGRFMMCVCLAEAETIRRIIHLREDTDIIDGFGKTFMALRNLTRMETVMDSTTGYKPPPDHQLKLGQSLLRFFDGEVFFNYRELSLLIRHLQLNATYERKVFFENLAARKRRANQDLDLTPIKAVFNAETWYQHAFPVATRVMLGLRIAMLEIPDLTLTFERFDYDNSLNLDACELSFLLQTLAFLPTPREVLAFVDYCDKDGDGQISLGEFQDALQFFFSKYGGGGARKGPVLQKTVSSYVKIKPLDEESKERTIASIDLESKALDEEARSREDQAESLRAKHKARIDAMPCVTCSETDEIQDGESEAKREANPQITPGKRIKWDFAAGRHPSSGFRTYGACVDFLLDVDADEAQKKFMRPDLGARVEFSLPDELSVPREGGDGTQAPENEEQNAKEGEGERAVQGYAAYSITVCVRLLEFAPKGFPLLSLFHDQVIVTVHESGEVRPESKTPDDDIEPAEGDEEKMEKLCNPGDFFLSGEDEKPRIVKGEWSAVTVVVSITDGRYGLTIYVDGAESHPHTPVECLRSLDATTRWHIASTEKGAAKADAVTADLRFVCLDLCELGIEGCQNEASSILELHVPVGVWRCPDPCGTRNGVGLGRCRACQAEKRASGVRPANDMDPEHPGLTIVVSDSFQDIVLNEKKHVFLDVSGDWCGPSVQMKPEWHALANLLKDNEDIVIAYMDTDANEKDKFYLSETHVPNLKLFPAGNKSNYVCFNGERTVAGFVEFLEQHAQEPKIDIQTFAEQRWPTYCTEKNIAEIQAQAQAAVVFAACERINQWGAGEDGFSLSSSRTRLSLVRFLSDWARCPSVFQRDAALSQQIRDGKCSHENLDLLKFVMEQTPEVLKQALLVALPDDPIKYLAATLERTPVYGGRTTPQVPPAQESMRPKLHSQARKAIIQHASGEPGGLTELERLLDRQGLSPKIFPKENGESLVCLAASYGDTECLEMLFDRGADLNEAQPQGRTSVTPIEQAAWVGHESIVQFLLENGAFYGRALHLAARAGHVKILGMLLEYGAHPEVVVDGHSPMTLAVLEQKGAIIQKLVHAGVPVRNHLSPALCRQMGLDKESTILHAAAKLGFAGSVRAIMDKCGASAAEIAEMKNKAGVTPMDLAPVFVKPILNPEYLHSLRTLREATVGGQSIEATRSRLRALFDDPSKHADANAQDIRGWTPLINAAIADDVETASFLLERGAKWPTQGRFGMTALFWAEWARLNRALCGNVSAPGHGGVAALLRAKGASLSFEEEKGLKLLEARYRDGPPEVKSILTIEQHERVFCVPSADSDKSLQSAIIDRIMDGAASFESGVREILPANWVPKESLEESIVKLDEHPDLSMRQCCEKWDSHEPGEGDFPSWKSLIQHSKLFVQERVAAGDDLPPQYILALHLYTIPCNLFTRCNAAMRHKEASAVEPYRVFIWHLWQALEKLRVKPYTVYRGIPGNPIELLAPARNHTLVWCSFSSTSWSLDVASSFMSGASSSGILFKIRAKRTREIANYSYRPHERELLLPPMTVFKITGTFEATHYNLQYGNDSHRFGNSEMYVADSVPPRRLNPEGQADNAGLEEYQSKFVLVVLEEADLD
jgi:ankyrin repeat protein/thiol-disulfide isomerase/thioredoxin